MDVMLGREEALALIRRHVLKENNVKHMIAVGAVMRQTATRLSEDADRWEMVGLLHDIDFECCKGPEDHTIKAQELLTGVVDEEMMQAIMAHNHENTNVPVDTRLKKALIACDAVSGLVLASALVMPSKKVADVRPGSLMKKFNSKDFAKGVSRPRISICVELGIPLEEFLALSLDGMRNVAAELGL